MRGGKDESSHRAGLGGLWVVTRLSRCKSYGRISNIIMESLFKDQKRGWDRTTRGRRGGRQSKTCHSSYTFVSGLNQEGEKIRAVNSVQNTLINQQRTSQMMRCSPTGHDDGYTGFPATWQTVLVSKLGEFEPKIWSNHSHHLFSATQEKQLRPSSYERE